MALRDQFSLHRGSRRDGSPPRRPEKVQSAITFADAEEAPSLRIERGVTTLNKCTTTHRAAGAGSIRPGSSPGQHYRRLIATASSGAARLAAGDAQVAMLRAAEVRRNNTLALPSDPRASGASR